MEVWRDIKGYEGQYQVSNHGRVKSLERRVRNHPSGSTRLITEHFITSTDNGYGYKIVSFRSNEGRKNYYVHRLVAEYFLDKPPGKDCVNHIDYDKSNNMASNLEWCTQMENVRHSIEHLRNRKTNGKLPITGERYIGIRHKGDKVACYRVHIKQLRIDKSFKTLDDAVTYRNEVMKEWQNQ